MDMQIKSVTLQVDMSLKVIRMYDWLLDMYVLDFFVDNHWEKLPDSWKKSFQNLDPQILGKILSEKPICNVLPLSFLALIQTVNTLSIPRKSTPMVTNTNETVLKTNENSQKLKNLFSKHVKLKKRHEIDLMAEVVKDTAIITGCNAVIDFGSGLGHLVRVLGYKYDLYAAGIECQSQLTENARKLDSEFEYTAKKHLSEKYATELLRPIHFHLTLSCQKQLFELPLPQTMEDHGLVGLHPCGDLGPILLKHFVENDKVKFICLVGCCFMKLTPNGYPMSCHVKKCNSQLSYVSREISCHAIESYCERLVKGDYEDLKIHAYRAALESLLLQINPKYKHSPVRSVKHSNTMTFERYCSLALEKISVPFPTKSDIESETVSLLAQWRRVVTVYTLRLMLAPLVETVILLDRQLFALERGMFCEIRPVFDPLLSPRNHIMIATRRRKSMG